jgi:hypothetical protein
LKITDTTIYLTDNGAALCGAHLGNTARTTGRDISGQPILEITPDIAAEYEKEYGEPLSCETCGAQPGDAEIFAGHIERVRHMSATDLAALIVPAPTIVHAILKEGN